MKKNILLITVIALFAMISCNQANNDSKQTEKTPAQHQLQEKQISEEPQVSPSTQATDQAVTGQNDDQVMLNPPHGQPNHRCDIPVGSPLNSPPAGTGVNTTNSDPASAAKTVQNPSTPTIENAMRMNTPQTQEATGSDGKTTARLNPPHGQPGHRCDIPVGSPLPAK